MFKFSLSWTINIHNHWRISQFSSTHPDDKWGTGVTEQEYAYCIVQWDSVTSRVSSNISYGISDHHYSIVGCWISSMWKVMSVQNTWRCGHSNIVLVIPCRWGFNCTDQAGCSIEVPHMVVLISYLLTVSHRTFRIDEIIIGLRL